MPEFDEAGGVYRDGVRFTPVGQVDGRERRLPVGVGHPRSGQKVGDRPVARETDGRDGDAERDLRDGTQV